MPQVSPDQAGVDSLVTATRLAGCGIPCRWQAVSDAGKTFVPDAASNWDAIRDHIERTWGWKFCHTTDHGSRIIDVDEIEPAVRIGRQRPACLQVGQSRQPVWTVETREPQGNSRSVAMRLQAGFG